MANTQNWEFRGPINVGGRTRALSVDWRDNQVIIAGGVSGGMFRSADAGESWRRVSGLEESAAITAVVQSPGADEADTWYFATGEATGNSASATGAVHRGDGFFKSTDNGVTWQALSGTSFGTPERTEEFDFAFRLAMREDSAGTDDLYAAIIGSIVRSPDGGETWQQLVGIADIERGSGYTDVEITSTGVVYATLSATSSVQEDADTSGFFRSEDGVNFENITPEDFPLFYDRVVMDSYVDDSTEVVWFLAETPNAGTSNHSVWKYTHSDTGGVFEDFSDGIPMFYSSQGSYNQVIAVKPDDPDVVIIGGVSLYRSTDGMMTMEPIGGEGPEAPYYLYPNHWVDQHALVFDPEDPSILYCGNDGGVFRTSDVDAETVGWTELNRGYTTSQFYGHAIDRATPGSALIVGGLQDRDIYGTRTLDSSEEWEHFPVAADGGFCAVADGGNPLYGSIQFGRVIREYTDTLSGERLYTTLHPRRASVNNFIHPYILDPANTDIMYYPSASTLWRCDTLSAIPYDNSNATNSSQWRELPGTETDGSIISTLAASFTEPAHRVYYGTRQGKVYRLDSADTEDPSAIDVTSPDFPQAAYVHSISVDPYNGDNVMVGFSNYEVKSVFYSNDAGETWQHVGGNLEEDPSTGLGSGPSVRAVHIMRVDSLPLYFAGTSAGLYSAAALEGDDTKWLAEGRDVLGTAVVATIDSRTTDGFLTVATHGSGVYSSQVVVTSVNEQARRAVPSEYVLHNNYPNPFNPSTTISFTIPAADKVSLKIYDLQGALVATLLDGDALSGGSHQRVWDGRNSSGAAAASGVYLYRLHTPVFSETKRMLLLK